MSDYQISNMKFAVFVLLGLVIYCRYFRRREHFPLRVALSVALTAAVAMVIPPTDWTGPARILYEMGAHALILALFAAGCMVSFEERIRDILLKIFASITTLSVLNFLTGFVRAAFASFRWPDLVYDLAYLTVYVVLFLLGERLHRRGKPALRSGTLLVVFISVAITIALCGTSVSSGVSDTYDFQSSLGTFMLGAYTVFELLCVSLVVVFTREEFLHDDNLLLNRMIEAERRQYE